MAELAIDAESVTVVMSTVEKVESLHGDLVIARSAVRSVRAVSDGLAEVHGLRAPGTGIPGVIAAGTFHGKLGRTFAIAHHRTPAVVLELSGHTFDRVVVTVDDPAGVVRRLGVTGAD